METHSSQSFSSLLCATCSKKLPFIKKYLDTNNIQLLVHCIVSINNHNPSCSLKTNRGSQLGCMSMIVKVPGCCSTTSLPHPDLLCIGSILTICHRRLPDIFFELHTMHSTKKNKPLHVSQACWLPKSYKIHSESHFTSLLHKDGKYHKHALGPV